MKRIVMTKLGALLLVFVLALGSAMPISNAGAEITGSDVVILICVLDQGNYTNIIVFSSSSSTNAPTVASGTSAAQALADLFAAGFKIEDVQPPYGLSGAVYTLVKK